jgi:sugar (pentulose or hexulose) kinase
MSYYLAIDLGTTGCRSIVFDGQLNGWEPAIGNMALFSKKTVG